jgi:hypothetical protein
MAHLRGAVRTGVRATNLRSLDVVECASLQDEQMTTRTCLEGKPDGLYHR